MLVDAQDDMTCVGTAGDGAAALELCAAEHPDVLLLDLRMPVMNGIETLTRLAASTQDRPRVVALTTIRRDDAVLAAPPRRRRCVPDEGRPARRRHRDHPRRARGPTGTDGSGGARPAARAGHPRPSPIGVTRCSTR
ncbi:response regulator [Curtobacterium flaccumfaciens]|nr:response regulator [Curtobacterium flaccumfaciens]